MGFRASSSHEFSTVGLLAVPPGAIGVYGIFRTDGWVYIGQGQILERLLSHLRGDNPCIARSGATNFVFELSMNPVERERELLREISTSCNVQQN
jgi:hypothetical protein